MRSSFMEKRGKGFPRLSLLSAVQVIEKASKFGKSWPKEQFAGFSAKGGAGSARSGAFAARISSLRDYGLVISDKSTVTLTELALQVTKPVSETERLDATKQAFLSVETFNQLYEHFEDGVELPVDKVAEHAVYNMGISRDSKDKFVSAFVESGVFVGLVKFNKESNTIAVIKELTSQDVESVTDSQADSYVEQKERQTPVIEVPGAISSQNSSYSDDNLNKIEIVLREGIKAGIYAPYSLTDAEKLKLKAIIDLL